MSQVQHTWIPRLVDEPEETDEEREQREYEEFRDRESRRKPPPKSGWRKGQPRCGACSLFIATPGATCSCGFDNGRGRYLSAA